MQFDRFFIAPFDTESGLQNNVRPWLIPDTAFSSLQNAYVFRGRTRKRFGSTYLDQNNGSQLLSRLRINIATTDAGGNTPAATFVPRSAGVPIATPAIGQMFSIGTQIFTVVALGTPAVMLISGAATVAQFNTNTGEVNIQGADINTAVYYYPALPVMGLLTFEQSAINNEPVIGFDTKFAYQYVGGWERLANELVPGAASWSGSNSQFFWATTGSGPNAADKVFYVTNFNEFEPNFMRTFFGGQWDNFRPPITASDFLNSARILIVFKNRLLALNTWEGSGSPGINYPFRARYSQVGSPTVANSWRQDIPGRGNAIDCPTTEAIISAQIIKDHLIVFCENSTWELAYTNNQAYPFVWQQINDELGVESTFSIIPFDQVALGVGNVGIQACNSVNVERIDTKIPDLVFSIHNADQGINRVYGVRDYTLEMVYWSLPNDTSYPDFPYPNQVLVYNYVTNTWALNDDSITCFGNFQPVSGVTWDSTEITWDDDVSWDSGTLQSQFRQVIAGNQEGYTFICDGNVTTNASVLQITNLVPTGNIITITCVDHNLREGDYVYLENIIGTGNLNLLNDKIFAVYDLDPVNRNQFNILWTDNAIVIAGIYSGAGVISRVSKITVATKQYNFYAKEGRNAFISKVDFLVDSTPAGQMQVQFYVSTATTPLLQDSSALGTNSLVGTGNLDTFPYTVANINKGVLSPIPFEATASRLWRPCYLQADGEVVQLVITFTDEQMRNVEIRESDFALHAMVISAKKTSRLL